jgi:hypothetical protein
MPQGVVKKYGGSASSSRIAEARTCSSILALPFGTEPEGVACRYELGPNPKTGKSQARKVWVIWTVRRQGKAPALRKLELSIGTGGSLFVGTSRVWWILGITELLPFVNVNGRRVMRGPH